MKKVLIALSILIAISSNVVIAAPNCGQWAIDSIERAFTNNIILDLEQDFYAPITRAEIAQIIALAYNRLTGQPFSAANASFSDISDKYISTVCDLGIMTGYGDGTFLPDSPTSRQEMTKIILTYHSVLSGEPFYLSNDQSCTFSDYDELSEWAKPYVVTATTKGFINGYDDGNFGGLKPVSWQEAIVLIERIARFDSNYNKAQLELKDFDLHAQVKDSIAEIIWNGASAPYTLTITEQRLSRYDGDIPPNTPVVICTSDENKYSFEINPNKMYTVKLSDINGYDITEFYTPAKHFDDMQEIYSTYPTSKETADALMVDVTVPVWKLGNNSKYASSVTFKVHNKIADKVKLVFEEIFNGSEKFPIKDIGGYSWREGTSEHNGGTAIDINSNENYCIYNNGTTIGSHWKPHEDPYSITPYGDVVRAFEKYGFTWGGDSWSNPKDYMHFSYLGT